MLNLHSFDLPIPLWHLTEWKQPQQPVVHVSYTISWKEEVEVKWFAMHPDVSTLIVDWAAFKKMLQEAAEGNAENHKDKRKGRLAPGHHRPPMPQPGEDPFFDAQLELNWK